MKENLKVTRYSNGDSINTTYPDTLDISGESSPKYQWAPDGEVNNIDSYGRLYTWYAANDSRKVCPSGWHMPTKEDWYSLGSMYGYYAGIELKEAGTAHWSYDYNAKNSSGFTALPGGHRTAKGEFLGLKVYAEWWNSSENNSSEGVGTEISFDNIISEFHITKNAGNSVRCIMD
jgi:uncharacterized protein (TIGR02145 family)